MGLVLLVLELYRIILLVTNSKSFKNFGFYEHIVGIWFDLITVALFFLPFIFLFLIPVGRSLEKVRSFVLLFLFASTSILIFFFNAWDVAYFSYTEKRTSYDYLIYMLNNPETTSLAGDFLLEFWWLILFFILSFSGLIFGYLKLKNPVSNFKSLSSWVGLIVGTLLTILIGRGGFQLKPVGVLESTNYCSLENSPAVLNSAFTIIKTYDFVGVEKKDYFSEQEVNRLFNPIQKSNPQYLLPGKPNVVFILFESFGTMYCGPASPASYTPFLDSILSQSMYFDYGIANARTSMDALPTVVSSIPTWMNESFILSSYSSNQFEGFPSILKKDGYESAFFHGATNGSMRFDAFASAVGFDHYFGRSEYGNDQHFDGNWGIEDHHFMSWSIDQMNEFKKPFFSMIFTLSSHHPFTVPKEYKNKVRLGLDPLCKTINYVDFAFKSFWKKAQKQDWFKNTLFIFCADHVGPTSRADRASLEWGHRIPIAFYHASGRLPQVKDGIPFQQIDILPTALDLLNQKTSFFAMGSSYFKKKRLPKLAYSSENLIAFEKGIDPILWNEQQKTKRSKKEISKIRMIKAIYQQYTSALIQNKMKP
ncbi:MAG: LTA synthase family protein [Bacteroidetes bacterium]|nr:LTA synthase family protein [Bacteroidota bacterium]